MMTQEEQAVFDELVVKINKIKEVLSKVIIKDEKQWIEIAGLLKGMLKNSDAQQLFHGLDFNSELGPIKIAKVFNGADAIEGGVEAIKDLNIIDDISYNNSDILYEDYDELPDTMRNARRWLLWKYVKNKDPKKKDRKVPFYSNGMPRNGTLDTDIDKGNMDSLMGVVSAFNVSGGHYSGIGFALGDGWQGVDLDDMDNHPELKFAVDDMPSYVERSPSGNGFHGIGFGCEFEAMGSNKSGIEAYSKGRFFTVTGESVSGIDVHDLHDFVLTKLKPLHSNTVLVDSAHGSIANIVRVDKKVVKNLRSALNMFSADDRDNWVKFGQCLCELGDVGRCLFMDWSEQSDKFDPMGDAKTWDSFTGDRAGYKGVFQAAYDKGWDGGGNKENDITASVEKSIDDSGKFKTISFKDILSRKQTNEWLIKDWIEPHSLVQIFGASSSGKSFFALDMAYCISSGIDFFGNATAKGNVLYIAGEGFSGLGKRSKALHEKYSAEIDDFVFEFSEQPAQILNEESCESIKKLIDEQAGGFAAVFIDTLNRNMGVGDENSTKDMTQFVTNIDRYIRSTGAAVVWVHHSGLMDKSRARGSGSVYGALSTELKIEKNDDHAMVVTCTKQKEADDGWRRDYKLETVTMGVDVTSCVVIEVMSDSDALRDKEQAVLDALREEGISNGVDRTVDGSVVYTVTDKLWRDNAFKRIDGNNKRRDYGKYKKSLIGKGMVFEIDGVFYVKR